MMNFMFPWMHRRFSSIHRFLSKFPGFRNPEKHSLRFMNVAQFCGALNDNIYKLVLIFFLIQLEGTQHANAILSAAGAIFVIPFLLFSSAAGILADRFSKNRMVIVIKTTEIIIMVLAVLAFAFKFSWSSYAILFLLSTQSAFFGPPKYGIIPEIVPKAQVSKANGLITSFTYLAIITGTFLASFLTKITHNNYVVVGLFCVVVAVVGFVASFGVKHTKARGTKKTINILFVKQIWHTLSDCRKTKHLLAAILGSSYFLFIGAFTQLNIIPYAIVSEGLTEVEGGYLFLTTALGIAFGAIVSGRASKKQIELGLACIAGIVISLFFFILAAASFNIPLAVFALFVIGFAGGNFIVPFDTFIQLFSPESNRGHVIAASNFLSFVGVFIASICLYLFNQILGLTAAQSFVVMGVLTFIVSIILIIRLSDLFLSYLSQKILQGIVKVKANNLELVTKAKNPVLMLEECSPIKAWLLCGFVPNLHILVPQYKKRSFPWFERFFFSLHRLNAPNRFETIIAKAKPFKEGGMIPAVYLSRKMPVPDHETLLTKKPFDIIRVRFSKKPTEKYMQINFSK